MNLHVRRVALTSMFLLALLGQASAWAQELILEFTSGGDGLRGGDDNVHLQIRGEGIPNIEMSNLNQGQQWPERSVRSVRVPLSPTLDPARLTEIRLYMSFGGGLFPDDWHLERLRVYLVRGGQTELLLARSGSPLKPFSVNNSWIDFALPTRARQCVTDNDCSDGRACNGPERCVMRRVQGDEIRACQPALEVPPPCTNGSVCDEGSGRCIWPNADADGDSYASYEHGGDDCDDNDALRYPGATEVCDAIGRDEDCDTSTFGDGDLDRDGHVSAKCFNWAPR